jgi:hypothetical protein
VIGERPIAAQSTKRDEDTATPIAYRISAPAPLENTSGMIPAMKAIHVIRIGRMASKNAILIVEFAREIEAHGRSVVRAPVEASRPQRRSDARLTRAVQLPCAPDTVGKQQG